MFIIVRTCSTESSPPVLTTTHTTEAGAATNYTSLGAANIPHFRRWLEDQIFFDRRVKYFSPPADRCPRSRRTTRAPTSSSRTAWCRARGRGPGRGRSRPPTPRSSRATRRRWPRPPPTATSRTPSSVGSYWGGTIFWEQLAIGKSKNKSHKLVRISSLYPSYYLQFTFTIYIQHLLSHLVVSIHKLFYTIVV